MITNITTERADLSDAESSENEIRLKIDDHPSNFDEQDSPLPIKHEDIPPMIISPSKKKSQSSRKKVLSHLIGTTANTLSLDEPSPIKFAPNDSQFSEVKQTKSGRTIKYTPYFKSLCKVQRFLLQHHRYIRLASRNDRRIRRKNKHRLRLIWMPLKMEVCQEQRMPKEENLRDRRRVKSQLLHR